MSFFVRSNGGSGNEMSKSEIELRSRYNMIGIMIKNKKSGKKSRKGNSAINLDNEFAKNSFV